MSPINWLLLLLLLCPNKHTSSNSYLFTLSLYIITVAYIKFSLLLHKNVQLKFNI